jgi:hypothetical protein
MLPLEWMDTTQMVDSRSMRRCARLSLRDGKRSIQKGFPAAGAAALYEAVLFGMRYYIARHKRCESFVQNIDLWDAASLFHALARAGVFEDPLSFNRFSLTVERALWQESFSFNIDFLLAEVEKLLAKLGVIPFNGSALSRERKNVQ